MGKDSNAEELRVRSEFISDVDDEISLVELWLVLVRRRKIVLIAFSLCLTLGTMLAFSAPTKFIFSTTIELAQVGSKLVEPVASVLVKLEENHIPFALSAENASELFGVDVKHPRGSKALIFTSSGLVTDAEQIRKVHQLILDLLIKDQRILIDALDTPRRNEYSLLEAQIKTEGVRVRKLKQSEILLDNSLEALGDNIISSSEDGVDVLQAQALNASALVGAEHVMVDYQSRLIELGAMIALSRPATAEVIAVRSLKPSGMGGMATITLSAMVGLFVGILVAFVQEFIVNARRKMRSDE